MPRAEKKRTSCLTPLGCFLAEGSDTHGDLGCVDLGSNVGCTAQRNTRGLCLTSTQPSIETQSRNLNPCPAGSKNLGVCHNVGKIFRLLINGSILFSTVRFYPRSDLMLPMACHIFLLGWVPGQPLQNPTKPIMFPQTLIFSLLSW